MSKSDTVAGVEGGDYFVAPRTPQIITPKRIGVGLFFLLCAGVGVVSFLVKPIFVLGALLAIFFAILIALYPFFGLLVYLAVLTINPAYIWPALAPLRTESLLGGSMLVATIIHKKYKHEKFVLFQDQVTRNYIYFVVVMAAAVPISVWLSNGLFTFTDYLRTVVLFFLILNLVNTEARFKAFIWIFLLLTGYTATSSAIAYLQGHLKVAQGIERAEGLSGADPNTLALTLALGVPFLIYAFTWVRSIIWRPFLLGLLGASLYTITVTGSRSGVIGMVSCMFFVWLTFKKKLALALTIACLLVIAWFLLPEQYQTRYSSIFSGETDSSTQGRYDAWKAGVNMFVARPILGVGVGNFPHAYSTGEYSKRPHWLRPHSLYVQLIAELGILGVISFGAYLIMMFRENIRTRRKLREANLVTNGTFYWTSHAITASLGVLLICSVFAHSLLRLHWYTAGALTVVIARLAAEQIARQSQGQVAQSSPTGLGQTVARS